MIKQAIDNLLHMKHESEGKRSRAKSNHASSLGDPCTRKLVYMRTKPELKLPFDTKTLYKFKHGNNIELMFKMLAAEAGIEIVHAQISTRWEEYNIEGHIDGAYYKDDKRIIIEIKGLNPNTWQTINEPADLLKKWWTARYLAQVVLYLWLEEEEEAELYLIDKAEITDWCRVITIKRDDWEDYATGLLDKAAAIEQHIKDDTLPDKINDPDICNMCDFRHECCPTISYGSGAKLVEGADADKLIELIHTKEANDEQRKAYAKAHDKLKQWFPKSENGKYQVILKGSIDSYVVEKGHQLKVSLVDRDET